jgi:hypothetical protein
MLSQPSFSSPLLNEDLPVGPQLVFTLDNRFFRHQACYSLLPAKPGGQADRVISLCKYKVVGPDSQQHLSPRTLDQPLLTYYNKNVSFYYKSQGCTAQEHTSTYIVKKASDFLVPSRDVTNQTLHDRE